MTFCIEGDSWHKNDINRNIANKQLTLRFKDMEGTFVHVITACITTQFHRIIARHLGKEYSLTFSNPFIEKRTDIHLVRQWIISHYRLYIIQPLTQTGNNRKRQLFQLHW